MSELSDAHIPYVSLTELERCTFCGQYENPDDLVWVAELTDEELPYHRDCPKQPHIDEDLFSD